MSCELCMSSVIEKLLSLPLQERLRRSARHRSPSLTNIIMIRKINLCLNTGQHYCIIRIRRQLLWECNTSHCYGVEGEIRNIKPTVSPDVRKPAQTNRRLVKSTEQNQNMERNLWEWFVSQYNQQRRNCKVVEPAICEPYTRISHRAWACNQEVSDDRRQPLMLPYDDKW